MNNLYRGPPIYVSYQISVHLATHFQRRRFFRNRPIRNKNCLWWPCLFMDRDEMSNLYREPSIDVCCQVSVHLTKRFRRRFKKSANQKQELSVAAMFVYRSGQNEQSLERTSIDASNQISVHLAERFQRRRLKCETLTDDGRQVMAKAHIAFGKVS